MFYKKKGIPEEGTITICTVKRILFHSVFCSLDEYENLEGMLHISEVSPGRIRNLRDYVKEEKKIICKVLKVDSSKGHIDLSLRRVNLAQRKRKTEEYKQEQKAEKILEFLGGEVKEELKEIYKKVGHNLINEYGSLWEAFQDIVSNGEEVLIGLGIDKKYIKPLVKAINERIKPVEIEIKGKLVLKSFAPNGVEIIKKTVMKGEEYADEKKYNIEIVYTSAPDYSITVKSEDYKNAEKEMKEVSELIVNEIIKKGGFGEFVRK